MGEVGRHVYRDKNSKNILSVFVDNNLDENWNVKPLLSGGIVQRHKFILIAEEKGGNKLAVVARSPSCEELGKTSQSTNVYKGVEFVCDEDDFYSDVGVYNVGPEIEIVLRGHRYYFNFDSLDNSLDSEKFLKAVLSNLEAK